MSSVTLKVDKLAVPNVPLGVPKLSPHLRSSDELLHEQIRLHVLEAPDRLQIHKHRRRILHRAINLFMPIFDKWISDGKTLDEGVLDQFQAYLKDKKCSRSVYEKYVGNIRNVFNKYLLPHGLIKRPFVHLLTYRKRNRLERFSPHTVKAIEWFEANGVKVKGSPIYTQAGGVMRKSFEMAVTGEVLAPQVRKTRVSRLIKFLQTVNKTDIRNVTSDDYKDYVTLFEERKQLRSAHKDLTELMPVFVNLKAAGFITENPLGNFPLSRKKSNALVDFISQDDIAKLCDLGTLDWKNHIEVRNRMICLLLYDLALRRNELRQLRTTDIKIEDPDHALVTIRSDIQKGKGKDEVQFFLFFPCTREILAYYLNKSRVLFEPKNDYLLVGQRGEALGGAQVARAVRDVLNKLGIRTFKGKTPSPHILRHTFATLNVAPLGAGLSLNDVVDRLRHVGYETAKKHYIHDNYYLKKEKLNHYRLTKNDVLGRLTIDDICAWLKSLNVSDRSIAEVTYKYNESKTKFERSGSEWIVEDEVLHRLKKLSLTKRAVRAFFASSGNRKLQRLQGKFIHWYPKDIVEEIEKNYETPATIMRIMRIKKTQFYDQIHSFKTLRVGGKLFIKKDSIFR